MLKEYPLHRGLGWAIVNNNQCESCEMRGLFISLVIHNWIGDVQDSQGVPASEMTYTVSGGALNSILTHSLAQWSGVVFPMESIGADPGICQMWSH